VSKLATLIYAILFSGCASNEHMPSAATEVGIFGGAPAKWMHTRADSIANQFRLCNEDCPARTLKTVAVAIAMPQTQQPGTQSTPQASTQAIKSMESTHIHFPSASYVLDAAARRAISQTVAFLNHETTLRRVVIRGRTDDRGNQAINDELALRRGFAIRNFLREKGLRDDINITVSAKGKCCYLADNTTEDGRSRNRRAELLVLGGNT
jgi:outer membrane protein OmpA-like peptidoglycan-associated protein